MARLLLENVEKRFGPIAAVTAFDLDVASGESVVILGPSGCGKTTTLRMVAGFERPTSGRITIGERVVAGPSTFVPPERRHVGVVFQSYALWPHMTVADNIGFGLTVGRKRSPAADVSKRVHSTLERVQLAGKGDRFPHELSGGQQQRVALARALVTEPEVLLLDEPLSNLDTRLREDMRIEVRRIQREFGITMIYITHDRSEALALADRVVALHDGRIEQVGSPGELYRRPVTRFVANALGQANFIPGQVVDLGHDEVNVVRFGNGQVVPVVNRSHQAGVGDTVDVCVRPSEIRIVEIDHHDDPGARGVVDEVVFLGDETHYVIRGEDWAVSYRVVEHGPARIERGCPVALEVPDMVGTVVGAPTTPTEQCATATTSPHHQDEGVLS